MTHKTSKQSTQQGRNVFVWSVFVPQIVIGWRVDDQLPVTIATMYRWIAMAVDIQYPRCDLYKSFSLFRVEVHANQVLTYHLLQAGDGLSRDSQELVSPSDYGIYMTDGSGPPYHYHFKRNLAYADEERYRDSQVPLLAAKASLSDILHNQILDRDQKRCTITDELDELVATWIFPPFLGYLLGDDDSLVNKYHQDPSSCDLEAFLVPSNGLTMNKSLAALFWKNIFGVDVDDDYRIVFFNKRDCLGGRHLKTHLVLCNGPHRPSDQFLRAHFERCLAVSTFGGDARDDYGEQEIPSFVEELGVYDDQIDWTDLRWQTELGIEVKAWLIRESLEQATPS